VAWFPSGAHLFAYLDGRNRIRLAAPDGSLRTGSASAPPGALDLAWSPDGSRLLVRTRHALWQYPLSSYKLAGKVDLAPPQRVHVPPAATVHAAVFAPRGKTIAVLLGRPGRTADRPRSEILLIDPEGGAPRSLFAVSGRLAGLDFSPDGSRVLTSWPAADQWLFLPVDPRERIMAVDGIAATFAPGSSRPAPFPRIEGWCCPSAPGGGG
jgi:Tol biopolymer transport system component